MPSHHHDLRDDSFSRPLDTKHFSEFLKILCGSFSYREHCITQPAHAQSTQFFVKEFDTELTRKQRNVFDDSQSNSPLLVFSKLDYCRKE